jgi:hypothetical protein
MIEHTITLEIYAHWGDMPPRYRIYVDDNLLTERDFIWKGTQHYIKENIIVNLRSGKHNVKVDQINNSGTLEIRNIRVDGVPSFTDFITA